MKLQRIIKTFVAIVLTIGTILASAPAAYAATPVPSTPSSEEERQLAELQQAGEQRYQAIQRMEQYLRVHPDGTFYLTAQRGAHIGVEEALFQELQQGMEAVNDHIRAGDIQATEVQTRTPRSAIVTDETKDAAVQGCVGSNSVTPFWWGIRIFIDSCNADQIAIAIAAGASAAGLCTAAPFPPSQVACAVIAAALIIRGGQFAIAATSGTGVQIDYNFALGITSIQPQ
ncbi:MAG: hypothetical protein AAGF95_21635 [Chloroflexota bacterium]